VRLIIPLLFFLALAFSTPGQTVQAINASEAVTLGGIKQWITIRGSDRSHPVLLFLHGGPGNSVMSYANKFTGTLQKSFVVVHWDQRESGKTAQINGSREPLTVQLLEDDAVALVNYLRVRFSQEKIFLMGHSWGGFLALLIAARHPELLQACFAVSPMVFQIESERRSWQWMVDQATEKNNQHALIALDSIHIPFQNAHDLYLHRSWLARLTGNRPPSRGFVEAWAEKWLALFNEASAVNFFSIAPEISCPVYFFLGTKDYQTHFRLTEEYFKSLKAERKERYWFENIGHNIPSRSPVRLQDIIIEEILPKVTPSEF
jgi:pimeloyl-ACP methyl ester carboxylesterase